METILVEEHYILTDVQEKVRNLVSKDPKGVPLETMLSALEEKTDFHGEDDLDQHKTRMKFMNDNNVRMQVLSYGKEAPSLLTGQAGIKLCQLCNDVLGEYVDLRPTRFQGLAVLPINEPEAAAQELRRSVKELGLKGALIAGRGEDGTFLDHPKYEGIFEAAAELNVPIYLHPAPIKSEVYQAYYNSSSYDDVTASIFASFGYGWHVETGIHAVRLVLSGLLDRYPNLQIILGHWGEFVPFFLERMDQAIISEHLKQPISMYFKNNFYITPSGM
ncbi:MAG: amidohydrolase family protein, partial [Staphylococcus simulans]|nr:amidohydrolase family protein [Staphylococcus simulans]